MDSKANSNHSKISLRSSNVQTKKLDFNSYCSQMASSKQRFLKAERFDYAPKKKVDDFEEGSVKEFKIKPVPGTKSTTIPKTVIGSAKEQRATSAVKT